LSGITNAEIAAAAAIVDTKLATIVTAGKVSNSATTATNLNTAGAIAARDASGNFSAGTITASLTGAASLNVLKAGDTMTGALNFSGVNSDITSSGNENIAIMPGGTGKVGVGITSPYAQLHIESSSPYAQFLHSPSDVTGNTTGIGFGVWNSNSAKGAIFYERRDVYGVGKMHFAMSSNNTSAADVTLADSKMVIDNTGNVGIGTTAPAARLEVASAGGSALQFDTSNPGYVSLKVGGIEVARMKP
ncbi:MAG: hypothetical protein NTY45_15225, partial [Elusimicrobia bacterium]|nr:hypothetical protein [Elusimicrobiota bacterium]